VLDDFRTQVKIAFVLDQNEDGFPPIRMELLNAVAVGDSTYEIKNAPFFTPNIAYADIVRATPTDVENQYKFAELVKGSSYTSLSIIILEASVDTKLMDVLREKDCVIEYGEFGAYRVLAVAVPIETDYSRLRLELLELQDDDKLSIAELALPIV
jgi:Domain of unknown function (DUF4265)